MPTTDEHFRKAEHNEKFCDWLLATSAEYYDWVLTAAFYAAVHYVEAQLAAHNHHSFNHANRADGIRRHARGLYTPYQHLKNLSMNARYTCVIVPPQNFPIQAGKNLAAVKSGVRKALGR